MTTPTSADREAAAICNAICEHDGTCTLDDGHAGNHEVRNSRPALLCSWPAAAAAETTDARNWRLLRQCITGKIAYFEQAAADWPTLDYKQWAEGLRHALIMMDGFEGKPLADLLAAHTAAACDAITAASQAHDVDCACEGPGICAQYNTVPAGARSE